LRSSSDTNKTQLEKKWKTFETSKTVLDRAGVIEVSNCLGSRVDKADAPQAAIECLSSVCATDFKASEIEIGISSTSADEPSTNGGKGGEGKFRQMGEEERGEWLVRVGEKD
jgi:20S proteasome subunit alpha 1